MTDRTVKQLLTRLEARGHGDGRHSEAYRLLRAKHKTVAAAMKTNWRGWAAFAVDLAEAGVGGKDGQRLSADSVRKIWERVCRDVAARAKAAATPPRRKFPSRIARDWRPQIVPPAEAGRGAGPPVIASLSMPASAGRGLGAARRPPIPVDAPFDFPTVDPDGNPLPEGKVFYEGQVRTRHGAEQSERLLRRMRGEDWFR